MDQNKEIHKLDQASALLLDIWPPLWRGLYLKLIKEGFNEAQAFELLKTYILAQNVTLKSG